jgi:hypothetical protein
MEGNRKKEKKETVISILDEAERKKRRLGKEDWRLQILVTYY